MQQIVDLQNYPAFQDLNVAYLSIAFDSAAELNAGAVEYGIEIPLLTDSDHQVSIDYEVLQWATGSGEPGHTFILVNTDGTIAWIQDYGAPENGGVMYVPVDELTQNIQASLKAGD
jgi:peroxiredoxin